MMCCYLNVQFQDQRANLTNLAVYMGTVCVQLGLEFCAGLLVNTVAGFGGSRSAVPVLVPALVPKLVVGLSSRTLHFAVSHSPLYHG